MTLLLALVGGTPGNAPGATLTTNPALAVGAASGQGAASGASLSTALALSVGAATGQATASGVAIGLAPVLVVGAATGGAGGVPGDATGADLAVSMALATGTATGGVGLFWPQFEHRRDAGRARGVRFGAVVALRTGKAGGAGRAAGVALRQDPRDVTLDEMAAVLAMLAA